MSPNHQDSEDRNTILTRFIVFYIISILCFTVPLYYLFNIPDKVLSELKSSRSSEKTEQDKLNRIKSIIDEQDKYVKDKKYGKEFEYGFKQLYNIAQYSIDKSNQFDIFLLKKVSDLYEQFTKTGDGGGKEKVDSLRKVIVDKDAEIKELTTQVKIKDETVQMLLKRN